MGVLKLTNNGTPVRQKDGMYGVRDTLEYEIHYTSENFISQIEVFLEDFQIDILSIEYTDERKKAVIIPVNKCFFGDSIGPVDLIINDEVFICDVWSKKMNFREVEQMIIELYECDDNIHTYYSKSKSKAEKKLTSGSPIPLSARYIKRIDSIADNYKKLFSRFRKMPHTVIRKKEIMCDYGKQSKEYDVNWLLNNIDLIDIDISFQDHPEAILIDDEYGWIHKIKAYENIVSFDNYENRIVLSGLIKIIDEISSAENILKSEIEKEKKKFFKPDNTEYKSFGEIRITRLDKTMRNLKNSKERVELILLQYQKIFYDANVIKAESIQLTPVFRYISHYREIFEDIIWLQKNRYSLDGELDLIGLKKVSKLYEIYCLRKINEVIEKLRGVTISLNYEPRIETTYSSGSKTRLIKIDNYLGSSYYEPDYVLEIKCNNELRYVILDAKYSRYQTAKTHYLTECSRKYLLDVGIWGEKYKKPDFFFIINPERSLNNNLLELVQTSYYPRVGFLCVKPGDIEELGGFIREYVIQMQK